MKITVVVPVLNEEERIADTLANLAGCAHGREVIVEVIVVDGGSIDRTREVADNASTPWVVWVDAPRGRGNQMNAGAALAAGDVLLFVHADTHLPPDAAGQIVRALGDSRVIGGNFYVEFMPKTGPARFFAWCYNIRSHLRIFYGDSSIFVRREVFERMGGYRAARIMEDIEFVRRLRREGKLAIIRRARVRSSSRRFMTVGSSLRMLVVWSLLHVLMAVGVRQETLEKLYPEVR